MRTSAYIGIDLGTSGCRALAIDRHGRELAQAARPLPSPRRGPDGHSEQDPALWWDALVEILKELQDRLGRYRPVALAVDATSGTLLLTDRDGRPLGPALMYDDARHAGQLDRIAAVAPPDAAVHSASSGLAKLLGLAATHARDPIRYALHQADWVLGRLTGRFGVSDENNCLKLGYDAAARRWPAWLGPAGLGVPGDWLPEVLPAGAPVAPLHRSAAQATGLPEGILVCAGTTDSTAASLAAGIRRPGDGVTVLGSTLVVKLLCARPVWAPEYGVYSHRLGDCWLAGGASNSGGAVLAGLFSEQEMTALSAELRPEERTGLDYYPLAHPGERFPVNDPAWAPRIEPRPPEPARFFQGLLEGIAEIERQGYERLRLLGAPAPRQVRTIGGGARNQAWRRIREIRLGVPVSNARHQQAAYGSALLALAGCESLSLEQVAALVE